MSLLSVFLGREVCNLRDWKGCEDFGQFDSVVDPAKVEAFRDKQAEEYMKEDLAKMQGFRAISVPGDGNCLAHAASKAILGIELLYHALRLEIQNELTEHAQWYREHIYEFLDDESAFEEIKNAAQEAVPAIVEDDLDDHWGFGGGGLGMPMAQFMGTLHIHAIANILRRPVFLMARQSDWERAEAGLYLPARLGPVCWTTEKKKTVLEASEALSAAIDSLKTYDQTDAEKMAAQTKLLEQLRSWQQRVEALSVREVVEAGELEDKEQLALEELAEDCVGLLPGKDASPLPPEAVGNTEELSKEPSDPQVVPPKLHQLQSAAQLRALELLHAVHSTLVRTPLLLGWSSPSLVHFCCLVPEVSCTAVKTAKIKLNHEALPNRDGQLVIMGGLADKDAVRYQVGGEWFVRGRTWPQLPSFMKRIEEFWKAEHPGKDLDETVVEKGWNMILPNLLNNVLDIAQLFNSLNVQNDDDPVWMRVRNVPVLVPRRVANLRYRLNGLDHLLTRAADRMRPIWVVKPDDTSVLTAGEDFVIEWGTLPRIAQMVEKDTGIKLEDQQVEIGWLRAGSASFAPNIAKATPFNTRRHVWSVPRNMRPGGYWLAVRLLPFEMSKQQIEGAGPPGGSFRVVAPKGADSLEETKKRTAKGWEALYQGMWQDLHTINPELADMLSEHYEAGEDQAVVEMGRGEYVHVDFDQMRIKQGFGHTQIRLKRDENDLKVDPGDVEQLKAMGFCEDLAKKALQAQDNNVEMAVLWLTEQAVDMEHVPPGPSPADMETEKDSDMESTLADFFGDAIGDTDFTDGLPAQVAHTLSGSVVLQSQGVVNSVDPRTIATMETPIFKPRCDEKFLIAMEKEASKWRQVMEKLPEGSSLLKSPPQPGLNRAVTTPTSTEELSRSNEGPGETPELTRVKSAPAGVKLDKLAWANVFQQARLLFNEGKLQRRAGA